MGPAPQIPVAVNQGQAIVNWDTKGQGPRCVGAWHGQATRTPWEIRTCEPGQDTARFWGNRADFCPGTLPVFQLQQSDNQKDCF